MLTSIRARLYAAFGFVAALTVLCSLVALYAFTTIGDTTTSIVLRSMPAAEESLRLAEGASRLLATVPGLMTAEDEATQKKSSGEIEQQVRSLATGINNLQKMTDVSTADIKSAQAAMVKRLDALQKAVEERIKLVTERQKLAASIRDARESFVEGVSPAADEIGETLRYGAPDIVGALDQLRRLMELKAEANLLGGLLTEGAIVTDPTRIKALLVVTDASKRQIDTHLAALPDEQLRERLKKFFEPLGALVGNNGIVSVRERELQALNNAQTAFHATQRDAYNLKTEVDSLVSIQSDNTREVSARAAGQIEAGRFILITLSVAALIAAILIAWLY
ncbi:MAG TPA: hypothetical protein VJL90_09530, partial [Pseudorhodoplanes sp.]|nr:hypothetical protein [Pseudorhodoplanes sp.]